MPPTKAKRPREVAFRLHPGMTLVNASHDGNTSVKVGLPDGAILQLRVHPTDDRNVVQVILAATDRYDRPLGSDAIAGNRLPTLAWAYLNTRTGEMTQRQAE